MQTVPIIQRARNFAVSFFKKASTAALTAAKAVGAAVRSGAGQFYRWISATLPKAVRHIGRFFKKQCRVLTYMLHIYLRKNVARSAAQFSFNVILTIFPLLICINWLVSLLHANYDEAIMVLADFIPPNALSILTDYLDYMSENSSTAMLYAGLFMMLTPASAALRSLQGILNDIQNRGRGGNIWSFLLSFVFAIVFLIVIYACMIILFTGRRLLNFIVAKFKIGQGLLGWSWLRFFVLFFLVTFMLYLLYRFLPIKIKSPKQAFHQKVYPGVIFSSIVLVIVSIIFSWFISMSTRYSLVYGSLASMVILMLWLYTCSNIIIIGAIVNRISNYRHRHARLKPALFKASDKQAKKTE